MGVGGAPWFLYGIGGVFAVAAEICGVSGLAFALARLSHDDHSPTPFGVFRDVERGDYGQMVGAQLAAASEKKGPGDLNALLRSNGTWQVG